MSASRQKKLRQELSPAEVEKKQQAQTEEAKAAKKLKIWTVVFYVAIAAMIVGILVNTVVKSGVVERTTTAATVSGHKLSAADMNYFYLNAVNNETYLPYLVDNTKPLTEQVYNEEDGQTWADLMMDTAMQTARNTYAVYDKAVEAGYTLSDEDKTAIEKEISTLGTYAKMYGYSDASAFLSAYYGKGCNEKTYRNYLTVNAVASGYYQSVVGAFTYTQEQIEAEAAANPENYTSYTYRSAAMYTSNFYTTELAEGEKRTEEETAAALTAAKNAAELIANAGKTGEENFASAYDLQTGTESTTDSTLKSNVLSSSIPSAITEWVTDSARKTGDVTTIDMANDAGCYAVMFVGSDDNTGFHLVDVRHILIQTSDKVSDEDALAKIQEIKAEYDADPTEENFAKLANELTEDTGNTGNKGGLYENVYPGQMVAEFNDWCFDAARKTGDVDIVKTSYGYHLMYFVKSHEQTFRDYMVESALMNKDATDWYTAATEAEAYTAGSGMKYCTTDVVVRANTSKQ